MDSRLPNIIMGLITVTALAFAGYIYLSKQATANPDVTSSAAPTVKASPSPLSSEDLFATATPSVTPTTSASPSASASSRTFTETQALTLVSETVTVPVGGSLFGIAQDYEIPTSALAKINSITDPNTVRAGQKIIIPDDVNDDTYTFLFVLNPKRLAKEKQKIDSGSSSLYSEPVSAAQTDTKGIYGIKSDSPFSITAPATENQTTVTLSSSDDEKIVTIQLEKHESGLYVVKKLTIKLTS